MEKPKMKQRTVAMAVASLLILVALIGRLWQLQIVRGEEYAALADGNRLRRLAITAPRGIIRDREGRVLADNRLAFTVSVVPGGLQDDADDVIRTLAEILRVDISHIEEALQGSEREYPYEPIRILRDVPPDVVVTIEERRLDLPGVILEQEAARRYPAGEATSHLVGYLLLATPEDLRNLEGARADDLVGRIGVERAYEGYLRGTHGFAQVEVNALSRAVSELGAVPPVPGADVTLTLDLELQQQAMAALQRQLDLIDADPEREQPAGGGAVVVLDVRTGAVLSMVSLPTFDANVLLTADRAAYRAQLSADPLRPEFQRTLQGKYAPGSTFKPVTLLAALGRRVVDPEGVYNATGTYTIGTDRFRDWTVAQGLPPAGPVNAVQAMERSVNDYFYYIGDEAGIVAIAETARGFGLGGPTGLDMSPSGGAGLVPDPAWKRSETGEPWFRGETVVVSIGQGALELTPLHMALLYAGFATRGTVYEPYLVQRITAPTGEILLDREAAVLSQYDADPGHWAVLHEGLRAVVAGPRGTARQAFAGFPLPVAGKTGSAQTGTNTESHAWFAAYAPADDPEIAVAVLIEHGGGGGGNAAPVACRVLAAYFDIPLMDEQRPVPQLCP